MTAKPISISLWLLLLIGGGLVDPNSGVTPRTVPASEGKELTMEEQIQRKLKEELRQAQLRNHWGGVSKFIVPVFEVKDFTVEEALGRLHGWGFLTSLEKLPTDPPARFSLLEKAPAGAPGRFSLEIRDATVVQVLDAIVNAHGSYTWEPYRSNIPAITGVWIVNVFPRGAKKDQVNLMNIRVPSLELKEVEPSQVLHRPYDFISELAHRYWEFTGGPHGFVNGGTMSLDFLLTLRLEDKSVREVLNEISIHSGLGWLYEPPHQKKRPMWRTL